MGRGGRRARRLLDRPGDQQVECLQRFVMDEFFLGLAGNSSLFLSSTESA
jgi:hypothetical protein